MLGTRCGPEFYDTAARGFIANDLVRPLAGSNGSACPLTRPSGTHSPERGEGNRGWRGFRSRRVMAAVPPGGPAPLGHGLRRRSRSDWPNPRRSIQSWRLGYSGHDLHTAHLDLERADRSGVDHPLQVFGSIAETSRTVKAARKGVRSVSRPSSNRRRRRSGPTRVRGRTRRAARRGSTTGPGRRSTTEADTPAPRSVGPSRSVQATFSGSRSPAGGKRPARQPDRRLLALAVQADQLDLVPGPAKCLAKSLAGRA